jgi:hypothetical protein
MTDREQLALYRGWNRELVRENSRLQEKLALVSQENEELIDSNANLRVERDAADVLLGAVIDDGLEGRP